MHLEFQPTPHQAGHAVGFAVANLTKALSGGIDPRWLQDAGLSHPEYESELLLLAASAAMHAVESSGLSPEVENAVAAGLFSWVRELPPPSGELLLGSLDETTDYYAQAASVDARNAPGPGELSELEAAFGDRLLGYGENNRIRGQACVRLCIVVPKALWSAQLASANQMLCDAKLLLPQ